MLLKKNNVEIFFVHIPRTAGRYVSNLFINNNFKSIQLDSYEKYNGIEERHLHHDLLKCFDKYNKSKKFTIIRNPLERFISSVTIDMGLNKNHKSFDFSLIENIIEYVDLNKSRYSFHNNWFRSQHEFISKDCKIWRYEDGFGDSFVKFIKNSFNIKIELCEVNWKHSYDDVFEKINITQEIKKAIKKIYSEDYRIFNYI